MSPNKHLPHLLVLPEDDANRQLANGFVMEIPFVTSRQVQVLPEVGGWNEVLDHFVSDHVAKMNANQRRLMVLLMDFDLDENRLNYAKSRIPAHLADRVFLLGVWSEPEALRRANLGSYEAIGRKLAHDCREATDTTWMHELLRHNVAELDRLRERVCPILFPPSM